MTKSVDENLEILVTDLTISIPYTNCITLCNAGHIIFLRKASGIIIPKMSPRFSFCQQNKLVTSFKPPKSKCPEYRAMTHVVQNLCPGGYMPMIGTISPQIHSGNQLAATGADLRFINYDKRIFIFAFESPLD